MLMMGHGALLHASAGGGAPSNTYGTMRIAPFTGAVSTHAGLHLNLMDTTAGSPVVNGIDYSVQDTAGAGIDGVGVDDYVATNVDFSHQNSTAYHAIGIGQSAVRGEITIDNNADYEWRVVVICPDATGKTNIRSEIIHDPLTLWNGNDFIYDGGGNTQGDIAVANGSSPAMFRGTWRNPSQATGYFVMKFGAQTNGTDSTEANPEQQVALGTGTVSYADTAYLRVNIA